MSGEILLGKLGNLLDGVRGRLVPDFSMAKITWFQTGGVADVFFQPVDEDDLALFLTRLPEEIPVTMMGFGSNVLARDKGVEGVVIRLSARGFGYVEGIEGNRIRAGAAAADKKLAAAALEYGLGGLEFYHGVPGAVGGALRMNAGANGKETCESVVKVTAFDRRGNRHQLNREDMGYSYRHSSVSPGLVFVSAIFEGQSREKHEINQTMEDVRSHREVSQPVREKTGGSTFKNPVGHSAWKLIDQAGMRGFMVGKAQISSVHCNFMINTGSASATDLETLGEKTREKVFENSGVELEWEIRRVGRK